MNNAIGTVGPHLSSPPAEILTGATLFLDLDGTLFDLVERPDDVRAGPGILTLLERLGRKLEGRLAVVSGRSIQQVDQILGQLAENLAVSGSHGCEHRWQGFHARPLRPTALETAAMRFQAFAQEWPGVLVEEKSFGVALHYRQAPQAETAAKALATALACELALHLQQGKMVTELRVAGSDKGGAVRRLMRWPPMAGTIPVFAGDDLTDEAGFAAARRLGGHGILIGEPRPTAADFGLPSPPALREWLWGALQ